MNKLYYDGKKKYSGNVSFILESDKYRGNVSFILESDKYKGQCKFYIRK